MIRFLRSLGGQTLDRLASLGRASVMWGLWENSASENRSNAAASHQPRVDRFLQHLAT